MLKPSARQHMETQLRVRGFRSWMDYNRRTLVESPKHSHLRVNVGLDGQIYIIRRRDMPSVGINENWFPLEQYGPFISFVKMEKQIKAIPEQGEPFGTIVEIHHGLTLNCQKSVSPKPAPHMTFPAGTLIDDELEARSWTQKGLASRIGISQKTVSHLINGRVPITEALAAKLAEVFGTSVDLWLNLLPPIPPLDKLNSKEF